MRALTAAVFLFDVVPAVCGLAAARGGGNCGNMCKSAMEPHYKTCLAEGGAHARSQLKTARNPTRSNLYIGYSNILILESSRALRLGWYKAPVLPPGAWRSTARCAQATTLPAS